MTLTDEDRRRRHGFALYLADAMRAASYVRPNGELDVPALSRMSGVADNVLRRWLQELGEPSLENLRKVAPALGLMPRDLWVAAELVAPGEVGLGGEPQAPPRQPTPEDRILADDTLSEDAKAALIQTLNALREKNNASEESRRRKRA